VIELVLREAERIVGAECLPDLLARDLGEALGELEVEVLLERQPNRVGELEPHPVGGRGGRGGGRSARGRARRLLRSGREWDGEE
jgi:hypothetical protein